MILVLCNAWLVIHLMYFFVVVIYLYLECVGFKTNCILDYTYTSGVYFMTTASGGWQYCKLTCYCICRPWPVVDVMEHNQ
jgi:hypothetical protein